MFINYLKNKQYNSVRTINTSNIKHSKISRKHNYFNSTYEVREDYKPHDLSKDKTGKSNVIGNKIDLISELILWCSEDEKWYNEVTEKNNINDITKTENNQRNDTIQLLYKLQDMNSPSNSQIALMIILRIFPELKQLFGSGFSDINNNRDIMLDSVDKFITNGKILEEGQIDKLQEEIKSYNNLMKEYPDTIDYYKSNISRRKQEINNILKNNNKYTMLSSYSNYNNYLSDGNSDIIKIPHIKNTKLFSNKQYLILSASNVAINDLINNYKFIDMNNTKYELIGIQLANNEHAVCFVKTGKSDVSWSGIDSNRDANDDGYKLEDIVYHDELGNNNKYLTKIYDDRIEQYTEEHEQNLHILGMYKYKPTLLLYQKKK